MNHEYWNSKSSEIIQAEIEKLEKRIEYYADQLPIAMSYTPEERREHELIEPDYITDTLAWLKEDLEGLRKLLKARAT